MTLVAKLFTAFLLLSTAVLVTPNPNPAYATSSKVYPTDDRSRFPRPLSNKAAAIYSSVTAIARSHPDHSPVPEQYIGTSGVFKDHLADYGDLPNFGNNILKERILNTKRELLLTTFMFDKNDGKPTPRIVSAAIRELNTKVANFGYKVRVYIAIDTLGSAFFDHQLPPLKSFFGKREKVSDPSHYGLPKYKEVPNLDFRVKTYHKGTLGTLHSKMIIIDNAKTIMGSKNMDADISMEYMYVMEGQVADAMRQDFADVWGEKLPDMGFKVPMADHVPVLVVSQKETDFMISHSEHSPQDMAFLTALDVATSEVYIQTPNLNTKRMAQAIVDSVRRGIRVTVVTGYRQQDQNERIQPSSVGSNYETSEWIKKQVESSPHADKFRLCWYIGKRVNTNIAPNPNEWSHVKAMVVDQEFAIVGSGNQDPNTWYHSRECNLLIDDPPTAKKIYAELQRPQHSLEHCFWNK
jgi:phosphatidylserine/phosphatidylglycerophosphate/cardiolipin synthase-like enzyme